MPANNSVSPSGDLALLEEVCLNALSFTSHSALFTNLKLQNTQNIRTLIDSGASDNFMDSRFAIDNGLALQNLALPYKTYKIHFVSLCSMAQQPLMA